MHRQLLTRSGFAALVGAVVVACSAPDGSSMLTDRQAVRGGEPTGESHAGVLYVTAEVRNLGGTAVYKIGSSALVAPNLLATALHVVSQNPSNVPFTCDANGDVVSGSSGASLGAPVPAEKVSVYAGPIPTGEPLARGVKIISTGSTTICQNDLAFVILDQELDLPTYRIREPAPVGAGEKLTVVGYGTGLSTTMDEALRTERVVSVAAVGQWIRTFTVTLGPCEGDSGGPALTSDGELVGIFSSVARDCTASNASPKYTDLSYFTPLVERAFDEAGAGSPWAAPSGDGGASGEPPVDAAGAPSAVGGQPPVPSDVEPREDDSSCSLSGASPRGGSSLAVLVAGGWLYRRVRRRART